MCLKSNYINIRYVPTYFFCKLRILRDREWYKIRRQSYDIIIQINWGIGTGSAGGGVVLFL